MSVPRAILFDDGRGELSPLTDLRASFEVRCGAFTALERLVRDGDVRVVGLFVPADLADVLRERHSIPVNPDRIDDGPVLAINGRWAECDGSSAANLDPGEAWIDPTTGEVIAACVEAGDLPGVIRHETSALRAIPAGGPGLGLLRKPWGARQVRDRALKMDLSRFDPSAGAGVPPGVVTIGGKVAGRGVYIHPAARVMPTAVIDHEAGPVVIDESATVRPGTVLIGPCYVGPHSTVLERATIRPGTAIGPWCKVNGEVSGTIFQGYANKAHDGFLGDSWVGEWVNLGAGTTNSNLLNTYGEVIARATPSGPYERTGEQFLGAVIGDHVKTAIGTRLYTGCVLGTGSMFACTAAVSGCVPAFSWVTDEGPRPYRFEKFMETARAAMGRRNVTPGPAYTDLLRRLAERAAAMT
jgi:UDP-N-acetylglucosamine diphosphorylase/glucosamine-1-phosphate N-acetyltransferase